MKDKHLYQRRIGKYKDKEGYISKFNYKGYTEDGFYYRSTTREWVWKQNIKGETKDKLHTAKTISELREKKNNHLKGRGSHKRAKGTPLPHGLMSTEEFAKLTKIEKLSKEYISRLLKRASTSSNEYDERGLERKKRGMKFVNCLKRASIEYEQIIQRRKVWVFKNVNNEKIELFKKTWLEKI